MSSFFLAFKDFSGEPKVFGIVRKFLLGGLHISFVRVILSLARSPPSSDYADSYRRMDSTQNQPRRAETEASDDLPRTRDETRIEQHCQAVRGLSPELKLAWYEFKNAGSRQQRGASFDLTA